MLLCAYDILRVADSPSYISFLTYTITIIHTPTTTSSASWCPPCKTFSPILAEFYTNHAKKEGVEIIYVSSDKTAEDFQAYFSKMPWLALPNDATASQFKAKLISDLHIQGIPSLIVLDVATGQFVTDAARGHVQSVANGSAEQAQQVITAWKSTTPVSFEVGLAASNDMLSLLKRAVMAVLKNPVYMFGMLYMVKWAYRKYAATTGGGAASVEADAGAAGNDHEPVPDDEF